LTAWRWLYSKTAFWVGVTVDVTVLHMALAVLSKTTFLSWCDSWCGSIARGAGCTPQKLCFWVGVPGVDVAILQVDTLVLAAVLKNLVGVWGLGQCYWVRHK
jgi:hypothetical protein